MAKINLLPWRAERRERRKREFFSQLIVAAVAAVVLVLLWGFWTSMRIDNQNNRNAYLKGQIQQLDAKITEIKNLQKVKDHLLARKRIVEKLQASRSQMVHLFDQMVDTIPAGARLTALKQQGDKLTLDGVAQSNATVAEFMRNIQASPWMGPAQLIKTENVHSDTNTPYQFELVVTLGAPNDEGKPDATGETEAAVASTSAAPAAATSTLALAGASTIAPAPATAASKLALATASAAAPKMAHTDPKAPDPKAPPSSAAAAATPHPAAAPDPAASAQPANGRRASAAPAASAAKAAKAPKASAEAATKRGATP